MISIITMLPDGVYTAGDVACYLKVSVDSVYQSIEGKSYRCKLGKPLPKPIKLGKLLRWKGSQIIGYLDSLLEQNNEQLTPSSTTPSARRPGRPRKQFSAGSAA